IALNLASTYSLTGKKTVLIGGDLRRPMIGVDFNISQKKGLSTWLIGMHKLDEIIQTTEHEQFYVIPAGPVPPNPSELLNHKKLCEFISLLKERFDYIIIDSAPIGTVSDSYAFTEVADATIILVRQGESVKKILKTTLAEMNASGLNHAKIVVNDLQNGGGGNGFSYLYGNSTKYGYGSK
ncbi:MAG: CpsD/CapB family tyrosine-protein kinase, partial [Cyclobacteriaceae bacterium]|nr:CpsD/CapB family tyrosine-protein kinase [Cyclobacteriaceae bacterium]